MGFVRELKFETTEKEQLVDITGKVQAIVAKRGVKDGFVCVYTPHTSAAVSIHRKIDAPDRPKLSEMLKKFNPNKRLSHYTKAALVAPTEILIVKGGKLVMDDDQRIYLYEFDGPKIRRIILYVAS